MRILYVNNINRIAETHGGNLTRHGHKVKIFKPSLVGGNAFLPAKLALMPWRVFDMSRVVGDLNRNHFDLVHIHWANYGVLGLMSRVPYIVECHGTDVRYRLNQPFFRAVLATIFRRAVAVLCVTPDLLPIVQAVRPDAVFMPAPVDTEQFVPVENNQCGLSRPWIILLFSRLDSIKGSEIAVQGIASFIERHPSVRVRLLDWGPLREQYKKRYSDRFEFIPCVAPGEVQRLIESVDVVVGQFALGALGVSELQAMSCAKPVIASFRYNDAYHTPPPLLRANSAKEIDEHLENLYQYPEIISALGQKAREWVILNHDSHTLSAKLEKLYHSLLF